MSWRAREMPTGVEVRQCVAAGRNHNTLEYPEISRPVPRQVCSPNRYPAAKWELPWGKVRQDQSACGRHSVGPWRWAAIEHNWSRNVLVHQIELISETCSGMS